MIQKFKKITMDYIPQSSDLSIQFVDYYLQLIIDRKDWRLALALAVELFKFKLMVDDDNDEGMFGFTDNTGCYFDANKMFTFYKLHP